MRSSFLQVIFAQGIVLAASLIKAFVIPKVLPIDDFSYWQIYVLYSGFVGVFALGYSDGIYLQYGGYNYENLPFKKLRATNKIYFVALLAFCVICSFLSLIMFDGPKSFALLFTSFDIVFVGISGLMLYLLQITNQIKKYSLYSIFDKILMLLLIVGVIVATVPDYRIFIVCDAATKAIACVALVICCKKTVWGESVSIGEGLKGYFKEVKIGTSLLIANLAGMLAVSAGRIIVETFGGTSNYAFYSFGVSITNLVLTFVSACGLVIYPNLKRMSDKKLVPFFSRVSASSSVISVVGLLVYFPMTQFVQVVFPQYTPLLAYLNLMFLAVAGQVKMQLLNNTYYKALRMEKNLLAANVGSVLAVATLSTTFFVVTHEVWWVAFWTAIVMLVRSWLSEFELSKKLGVKVSKSLPVEIMTCVLFLIVSIGFQGVPEGILLTILMIFTLIILILKNRVREVL